ncbi:MAG: T9SS type A sorting domain-containing protein [Bacteroidales bacterium]
MKRVFILFFCLMQASFLYSQNEEGNRIVVCGFASETKSGDPARQKAVNIVANLKLFPEQTPVKKILYTDKDGLYRDTIYTESDKGALNIFFQKAGKLMKKTAFYRFRKDDNLSVVEVNFAEFEKDGNPEEIKSFLSYKVTDPTHKKVSFSHQSNLDGFDYISWDFGDGCVEKSVGPNPVLHKYKKGGLFCVKMTIHGIFDSRKIEIERKSYVNVPRGDNNYRLFGQVFKCKNKITSQETLKSGHAYLLKYNNTNIPKAFDTIPLTQDGVFQFTKVPEGKFLIRVVPDKDMYPDLLPVYYSDNNAFMGSNFKWQEAEILNLPEDDSKLLNAYLYEASYNPYSGQEEIEGKITINSGGKPNIHSPISSENVVVYLLDYETQETVGFAMANIKGMYSFKELPKDRFYLYAEYPGAETIICLADLTLRGEENKETYRKKKYVFNLTLDYPDEEVGIDTFAVQADNTLIYPNPTSGDFTLALDSDFDSQEGVVYIYNSKGCLIQQASFESAKNLKLGFSISEQSSGLYIIDIRSKSKRSLKKVVLQK